MSEFKAGDRVREPDEEVLKEWAVRDDDGGLTRCRETMADGLRNHPGKHMTSDGRLVQQGTLR